MMIIKMKLLTIKNTPTGDPKKKVAVFMDNGREKSIKFGSKGSETYSEGASKEKQQAYLARHRVNENWNTINAGSLSRYILWSAPTISVGIKNFKNKFA